MAEMNREFLYNAALGDGAIGSNQFGSGVDEFGNALEYDPNSFVDAVSHPVDLVVASAADTFSTLYNLGATTNLYDPIKTSDVLETFANVGLPDAQGYFKAHPVAAEIGSLLTGGGIAAKVATAGLGVASKVASKALANSMKSGKVMFNDSVVELGKQARLEAAVADKMATDTVYGNDFKKLLSRMNSLGGGAIFADAVVQETVFAGLMSQHTMLEDYGWKDWLMGAGIYGGLSFGLKALSSKLNVTKAITDLPIQEQNKVLQSQMTTVPAEFRGTMAEAAIKQRDITELQAIESTDAIPSGTKVLAGRLKLVAQEQQINIVNRVLDTKGMSADMEQLTRGTMLDMLKTPEKVAGVNHIAALASNVEVSSLVRSATTKVIDPTTEYLTGHLPMKDIRDRLVKGESAKAVATDLGLKTSDVNLAKTVLTHQVYDLETKQFMDLHEATQLLGGVHAERDGAKLVFDKTITSGAVHASIKEAAKAGQKARGVSIAMEGAIPKAEGNILTRTAVLEYLNKHTNGIVNGKKLDVEEFAKVKADYAKMYLSQGRVELKTLAKSGYNVRELSRRLNLSGITDLGADSSTLGIRNIGKQWKGSEARNLLLVRGDVKSLDRIQPAVAADQTVLNNLANDNIRQIVAASGSSIAQNILDEAGNGIQVSMLEKLDQVNQATMSTRALGSSDFALRHQEIQDMANLSGTTRKAIIDGIVKGVDKDIAKQLHIIQLDKSLLVQWGKSELAIRNARAGAGEKVVVLGNKVDPTTGERLFDDMTEGGTLAIVNRKSGELVSELDKFVPEIADFWKSYHNNHASELFRLKNSNRVMNGLSDLESKGLILSPRNLTVGERAYLVSRTPGLAEKDRTILLHAQDKEGLSALIERARETHPDFELLTPGNNAKRYNLVHNHTSLGYMKYSEFGKAQTSVLHTGVATNTGQMERFLEDVLGEYSRHSNEMWKGVNGEVVTKLKSMIDITEGYGDGSNVWNSIYKLAFGGSELQDHSVLAGMNNVFVEGVQHIADTVNSSIAGVAGEKAAKVGGNIIRKLRGKRELGTHTTYEDILKDWESKGISKDELPWSNAADALLETKAYRQSGKFAESAVAFNNFTTATFALRFLEFAHPLINSLSIPITTLPEISAAMKSAGHGKFSAMKLMTEGIVRSMSAEHSAKFDRWLELGITTPHVAEMTKMRQTLAVNPSFVSKVDNNKVFKLMTKASDMSESMARNIAAGTADTVFDLLHKGDKATLNSTILRDAFVNTFVKRTQGNYAASQRPVMFQGTFGSMIGLFQTYMWTLGQNTYRFLEAGDKARVLQMGAIQTGIFGLESMPGYDFANQYIGSHFGNLEHKNINTFIFDQVDGNSEVDKNVAESIVYGFPGAMLDTALYTRGTLAPRSPISLTSKGGLQANFAAVAPLMTAIGLYNDTMTRFGEGAGLGDSFTAALQLQQLSRPFSRYADFVSGNSIERTGKVVDPMASFNWNLATLARATGARPLQDQIMRNLTWTNSYYNSQAGQARRNVLTTLRLITQQEDNPDDAVALLFQKYLDQGGSVMGFRSAINDAAVNDTTGKVVDIKQGSALEHIQSLYGYSSL